LLPWLRLGPTDTSCLRNQCFSLGRNCLYVNGFSVCSCKELLWHRGLLQKSTAAKAVVALWVGRIDLGMNLQSCPVVYVWLGNHSHAHGSLGFCQFSGMLQGRICFCIFKLKSFFVSFLGLYSSVSQTYRNVHHSPVKHHFWKYWGYLQIPKKVSEGSWETVQQRGTSSEWDRVMLSPTCTLQKLVLCMKWTKSDKKMITAWGEFTNKWLSSVELYAGSILECKVFTIKLKNI